MGINSQLCKMKTFYRSDIQHCAYGQLCCQLTFWSAYLSLLRVDLLQIFFLYHNNKGKKIFIDRFIIKDDFNHLCIKFFSFQTEQHSIQKLCSASENKINIGFLFTVGFGNLIGCIYFIETYNLITIILIAHLWWWSFIMPLWFSRLFLGFMIQTSILPQLFSQG